VIRLVAIGDVDADGKRTVFFELNGQPRRILVPDRTLGIQIEKHPKADPDDEKQVGAPLPGLLVNHAHTEGDTVSEGERICTIEAMKMESSVTAPMDGRIKKIHIGAGEQIETGDLLVTME
jgi:pyruvate carboxylase